MDVHWKIQKDHVDRTDTDLLPRFFHDKRVEAIHAKTEDIPAFSATRLDEQSAIRPFELLENFPIPYISEFHVGVLGVGEDVAICVYFDVWSTEHVGQPGFHVVV